MSLIARLLRFATNKARALFASYDIAKTNNSNKRHWANADNNAPIVNNSPVARATTRARARYERDNNCYCSGLVTTITADKIGLGPRAHVDVKGMDNRGIANLIGIKWREWCKRNLVMDKLRVLDESKTVDGESYLVFGNDPSRGNDYPQLTIQNLECDRVQGEMFSAGNQNEDDGIEFDKFGNATRFRILDEHPGGMVFASKGTWVNADNVIQWFRPKRAEQIHGFSELGPALPLIGQLRRYTLAVLGAAETAARIHGIMKTDQAADPEDDIIEPEMYDTIPLPEGGALLTLPYKWEVSQLDAKQPTGTYKEFKSELINEIGRCIPAPFNVVAGNSSGYNYSSGRLDYLPYRRMLRVERQRMEAIVLDRIFFKWLEEAVRIPNYFPLRIATNMVTVAWFFDGFESIDPMKDAQADTERLANNTTNLTEIYAEYGQDVREQLTIRAAENELLTSLGLSQKATDPNGVEKTALNGAQIASIVAVTTALAQGLMPVDSARAVLTASFPDVDSETINAIVDPFESFKVDNGTKTPAA